FEFNDARRPLLGVWRYWRRWGTVWRDRRPLILAMGGGGKRRSFDIAFDMAQIQFLPIGDGLDADGRIETSSMTRFTSPRLENIGAESVRLNNSRDEVFGASKASKGWLFRLRRSTPMFSSRQGEIW